MTDQFIKIGESLEVPKGRVKVYEAGGKRIAVCNVDGSFKAVADLCTHDGGPLGEGELIGNQIECPRHGALFDVDTGKAMCLPAIVAIATYKIEERNGELWVAVPASVTT